MEHNERLFNSFHSFRPLNETTAPSQSINEFEVPPLANMKFYQQEQQAYAQSQLQNIEPLSTAVNLSGRPTSLGHMQPTSHAKRHHPYEHPRAPFDTKYYDNYTRYNANAMTNLVEPFHHHHMHPQSDAVALTISSVSTPTTRVSYPPPHRHPQHSQHDDDSQDSSGDLENDSPPHTPVDNTASPKKMSFGKAALLLLRETKVPMTTTDLARKALERGIIKSNSKTPQFIMGTDISRDMKRKGDRSLFIRLSPGTYGLKGLDYSNVDDMTYEELRRKDIL
jgi:hypothetical protein